MINRTAVRLKDFRSRTCPALVNLRRAGEKGVIFLATGMNRRYGINPRIDFDQSLLDINRSVFLPPLKSLRSINDFFSFFLFSRAYIAIISSREIQGIRVVVLNFFEVREHF